MAARLEVSETTVGYWETGLAGPLVRHYGAIVRLIGYDPLPTGESLPARLNAARRQLGLTLKQMAAKLGLDEGSLSRWEAGSRTPSTRMAARVEELLRAPESGEPLGEKLSYLDVTAWRRRPMTGVGQIKPRTLGERLRHARLDRGMTLKLAASRFGVITSTLRNWETGAVVVPRGRMKAILHFINSKKRG